MADEKHGCRAEKAFDPGRVNLAAITISPVERVDMPRVLIPSDNRDFVVYLAEAYRRAGCEVVVGAANFDLAAAEFDLVHLQWPEELCGWKEPTEARLAEIAERLEAWRTRAKLVLTVHNLLPHRDGNAAGYRRLYDAFYQRVGVFAHFTSISREAVLAAFPNAARAQHIVTGYFNLNSLVPAQRDPAVTRAKQGFAESDFVVLIFGGLREWAEVELIRRGFDEAAVRNKRLLMCGRYDESGSVWNQRLRRWKWSRWLRSRRATVVSGFIPDAQVHGIVDAANVVVIPRLRALNSGLPALGASFGKIIVAPRCGAYPELLAGTHHPIYEPGNASALAKALEDAARLDRAIIAEESRRLAESWSWSGMVDRILSAAQGA